MKKIIKLILFCVPVAYLGLIVTVAVHEFGGHAFFGYQMGLNISEVVLLPDGMGWVGYGESDIVLSNFQDFLISISGITLTTLLGLLLVIIGRILYRRTAPALFLLIFGLNFILDGVTYTFFNSLVFGPPGDIYNALINYQEYRTLFLYVSGALLCASLFYTNYWMFKIVESYVGGGHILSRIKQALLLVLMFIVQAALFMVFDWNQLVSGIGQLPNKISLPLIFIILTIFFIINNKKLPIAANNVFSWKSIIFVWVMVAAMITVMLKFFSIQI